MKVALNTKNQNQSIKSIRCTFCEISIEFYSTSTEAPFEKTIIINNYFIQLLPFDEVNTWIYRPIKSILTEDKYTFKGSINSCIDRY